MRPLGVVSGESLQSELDQERRAKHRAMHELEQLRRSAKAHEQLTNAVIGSADLAQLLRRTLQVFTETGPFDVGVLRLRDGESIRVGATIGVDYDPEELIRRLRSGENEDELKLRPASGPRGVDTIPIR